MEIVTVALIFIGCIALLFIAGELLVGGLLYLSRYLGVKEFIVAFFVMAFASSVPNLFVGVTSALQGVPELSFGDIMGNNIVALTLGVGIAIFFSPHRRLPLTSTSLRHTAVVTTISALLPLVLLLDGSISRVDGVVLLIFFFFYLYWLFSRREHYSKIYEPTERKTLRDKKQARIELTKTLLGITLLAVSAQGVVHVAGTFSENLNIPLVFVGLVILGLSGALPELYFAGISARKGELDMVVGNLMGAVIVPATFVLGVVAIIHPIENTQLEFPVIARLFLVTIALGFFVASRTDKVFSSKEGLLLSSLYFALIACLLVFF